MSHSPRSYVLLAEVLPRACVLYAEIMRPVRRAVAEIIFPISRDHTDMSYSSSADVLFVLFVEIIIIFVQGYKARLVQGRDVATAKSLRPTG